jgi:hypothetical protein
VKDAEFDVVIDNLRGSDLTVYKSEKVSTAWYVRFTLPFALVFLCILFLSLPVKYMVTGKWEYEFKWIHNWFTALGF